MLAALWAQGCSGKIDKECPADATAREALCDFHLQRDVLLDNSFLPAEVSVLTRAMEGWTSATGGRVVYRLAGGATHDDALSVPVHSGLLAIVRLASSLDSKLMSDIDSAVAAKGSAKGAVVGYALPGRVMLLVERIPDMLTLQAVTMHELGHDLGLDHSPDTQSLMYARISGIEDCVLKAPHATTTDLEALSSKFCKLPRVLSEPMTPLWDEF